MREHYEVRSATEVVAKAPTVEIAEAMADAMETETLQRHEVRGPVAD